MCNGIHLSTNILTCNRIRLPKCRAGHNFRCPLISPWSVDPLINGTALIFHCGNVNLMEERLYLNLFMALALKILFCLIFLNLTLSTL
jgi:hypothetical protein